MESKKGCKCWDSNLEHVEHHLLVSLQHTRLRFLFAVKGERPSKDLGVFGFLNSRFLEMAVVQDQLEIKFRLTDGSDIGPKTFPAATSVATLKESVLAQWPKG